MNEIGFTKNHPHQRLSRTQWRQVSVRLTAPADGRFFVVEYKGANQWADAAEDRAIGEVWARATGNIYLMARAKDDHGRTTLDQLLAVMF